jgi:phosphoglycerol transferase MdoB-like AlkP superfamily enzyme
MAFLMGGSNAYELYVKNRLPSLVYTLSSQGYSRTGLHPYYANSWKRSTVYPLLGFESFISLENIIGTDLVNKQRNGGLEFTEFRNAVEDMYPNDNVLLRRFVSDSFDFKYLEKLYRERDRNVPFFLFNVTMQNHGGYEAGYTNFDQQIRITSSDTFYPQANRYLSLMRESDRAFEELVDYFSNVSKPTLILMFGDHQPNIEDEFIEEIMGSSLKNLSLEEKQKRYITPFVLWANYDIEENYIDMISSNYLSTLLLQTAGLETTAYNDYLSALYKYIPVIDTVGYITADGSYYSYDDQTEYTDMLNDYEKIQYNNLFDSSERHDELFYIQ